MSESDAYCSGTPRDRKNSKRIVWMSLAWATSLLGATYAIKHELLPAGPIPWMVAALPTIAGVFVLFGYIRLLRDADELQRMIQLNGLALGFGAGWIAMAGYPLFERLGAPQADVSNFIVVMLIFWAGGVVLGGRRYR